MGLWDLGDGQGLQRIEDPTIAQAILQKVNDLNTKSILLAGIPTTLFAILPRSMSVSLVVSALVFGLLYYLEDKIPPSLPSSDVQQDGES